MNELWPQIVLTVQILGLSYIGCWALVKVVKEVQGAKLEAIKIKHREEVLGLHALEEVNERVEELEKDFKEYKSICDRRFSEGDEKYIKMMTHLQESTERLGRIFKNQ